MIFYDNSCHDSELSTPNCGKYKDASKKWCLMKHGEENKFRRGRDYGLNCQETLYRKMHVSQTTALDPKWAIQ